MCLISHFECVCCGKKINALDYIIMRDKEKYRQYDWTEGMEYECPDCKGKFICSKIDYCPTCYDEETKKYRCSCAVPTFVKA